ncbi:MAG: RNA polymerase sigma factor [Clostridia bacterium]|nr:RNA polymerase sigma factor [Clostridia bacterium]
MESFDTLLNANRSAVEHFVRFKLHSAEDADDVLQEVYLTAYQKFGQLKNRDAFRAWIISIARNKCNDFFRKQAARLEIPLDTLDVRTLTDSRFGPAENTAVLDTLERLGTKDKQILYLYFWKEMPQADIARQLDLPLGTVKSRLHTAKQNFKKNYPHQTVKKGDDTMTKLPEIMPDYQIEPTDLPPFSAKWEELQGWLLVPRLGEKLSWGLYEAADGRRTEYTEMQVLGKAEVHGIEGVEISAVQYDAEDYYRTGSVDRMERRFIAQLTDTHCRYLAESHTENGVRKFFTFLDGDAFLNNWGFGEDNCGNETNLVQKGLLKLSGNTVTGHTEKETVDIVGRYTVTVAGKAYDTVCVMDIQCFNDGVASEQYIDKNGRTVLWRRFNRNDWAFDRYKQLWSEKLPKNEQITVNGMTYVHWYDCLSDYVL